MSGAQPVVDLALVRRVEQAIVAERRAFATGSSRQRPDGAVLEVGPGLAVFTGPELFSNRVFALGLDGEVDAEALDRIEAFYRERGLGTQIEVSSLVERPFLAQLAARDYRVLRFRNIYAMRQPEGHFHGPTIGIAGVDDDTAQVWSDVLVAVFSRDAAGARDAVARWNRGLLDTDGVSAFIARIDGQPVGSASVFVRDSAAVLGGAATLPGWRRRGVHAALISARLERARSAGCDLAVVTADPGSTSGRNSERAGFQLVCTHAVLGRAL